MQDCNALYDLLAPRAVQAIIDGNFSMVQSYEPVAETMLVALFRDKFNLPTLASVAACLEIHSTEGNDPTLHFSGGLTTPKFWVNADDAQGQTKTVLTVHLQY